MFFFLEQMMEVVNEWIILPPSHLIKSKSCVAQAPLGDALACSVVVLNQNSFIFYIIY